MTFIEISEILGNLGEFVGSIAVVATLIYLAVQVRYRKNLMKRIGRLPWVRHTKPGLDIEWKDIGGWLTQMSQSCYPE